MYSIGMWYRWGLSGHPKDPSQAAAWLRKAATIGNASAQTDLAKMYANGDGVPKDYVEAETLYLKAATNPDHANFAKSMLASLYGQIAEAYFRGDGVPKNPAEATKWYRKSLESGEWFSAQALARMYESGDGVTKDYAEAERLYQKCVEMLRARAEDDSGVGSLTAHRLAELLDKGARGVPKDHDQAVKLYISSAERGEQLSWPIAGGLYERGDGVPKDLVKAYVYYNLSSAYFASNFASNLKQREARDRVEKLLTPDQITEGQGLARKWREEHEGATPSVAMRPPTPNSGGTGAPAGGIASEISQLAQSGRYVPLPASVHCIPYSGTGALRTVENGTSYQLRLVFSGPVDREVAIAPGQKQSINLPVGAYKVGGV